MIKNSTMQTVLEMSFGLFIYEIILIISAIIVAPHLGYKSLPIVFGIIVGTIVTIGMLIDIAITTEDTVSSGDESYANKKTVIHSIVRKVALVIILILFWKSSYVNVIAIIIAALGLKPGAYLQPIAHRIFKR